MTMQTSLRSLAIGLLLTALSHPASARCCSCEAKDGSCSVSICCSGGCLAVCGRNDNCTTECASLQVTGTGLERVVTIQEGRVDGALAKSLSQETGIQIAVKAKLDSGAVEINASEFPVRRLLEVLTSYADITVAGVPFQPEAEPQDLGLDAIVSLEFVDADSEAVTRALAKAFYAPVSFRAEEEGATISLEMKDVTFRQAFQALARFGEVRIAGKPFKP